MFFGEKQSTWFELYECILSLQASANQSCVKVNPGSWQLQQSQQHTALARLPSPQDAFLIAREASQALISADILSDDAMGKQLCPLNILLMNEWSLFFSLSHPDVGGGLSSRPHYP